MTKVVVKSLQSGGPSSVRKKTVIGPEGRPTEALTVDASSPSFGEDLRIVFAENVKKASREYKRRVGGGGGGRAKS